MTFSPKQIHQASFVRPASRPTWRSLSRFSWEDQHNQLVEMKAQVDRTKGTRWAFSGSTEQILWGKRFVRLWDCRRREAPFVIVADIFSGCAFVHLSRRGPSFLLPVPVSRETQETTDLSGSPSRGASELLWWGSRPCSQLCQDFWGAYTVRMFLRYS